MRIYSYIEALKLNCSQLYLVIYKCSCLHAAQRSENKNFHLGGGGGAGGG